MGLVWRGECGGGGQVASCESGACVLADDALWRRPTSRIRNHMRAALVPQAHSQAPQRPVTSLHPPSRPRPRPRSRPQLLLFRVHTRRVHSSRLSRRSPVAAQTGSRAPPRLRPASPSSLPGRPIDTQASAASVGGSRTCECPTSKVLPSSAATLRPPSSHPPANTMNGYTNGADAARNGDGSSDSRGPGAPYPPIAEIIASATDTAEALRHHSVPLSQLSICVSLLLTLCRSAIC